MKLLYKGRLITNEDKQKLAQKISYIVCGYDFVPYRPNENDFSFWTLDSNNDWKLKIYIDEPEVIDIYYRYRTTGEIVEPKLIDYLSTRWDGVFIKVET